LKDLPVWLPLNQFSHPAEVQAVNINKSEKKYKGLLVCQVYTYQTPDQVFDVFHFRTNILKLQSGISNLNSKVFENHMNNMVRGS
jgi:hypothetical protein